MRKLEAQAANFAATTFWLDEMRRRMLLEDNAFRAHSDWLLAVAASGATLVIIAITRLYL
ncbi:hypothetical protein [Paracoccus indicus]|uniref:hypothetical protein n=1 Tax=Paracoccus indicus TaxID=2079229 RepID=UPI0013B46CAC|nr:hypothetical protein [Paracoccus indicus]